MTGAEASIIYLAVLTVQPVPLVYRQIRHKLLLLRRMFWWTCTEGSSLNVIEKHVVTTINELVMNSYLAWHTSRVFTYWNQVFFCSDNFLMVEAEAFLHLRPLGNFFTWLVQYMGLFSDQNTFKLEKAVSRLILLLFGGIVFVLSVARSSLGLQGTKQVWL